MFPTKVNVTATYKRVTIINEGVLSSLVPIKISLENNSMFGIQNKTLIGLHADYEINRDFLLGATILNLTERPYTQKINTGEEPISNTIWGFDGNYHNELPFSYVDAFPHTGRTHQIRVHFSHIKHPIINDSLYNSGINIDSYHQKYRNEIQMILKLIQRVALHSFSLELIHPSTNKKIKLKAPMPDDLLKAINVILRYNEK